MVEGRIQLLVGLGNPGPEYAATRHNAGFWLLDRLCASAGGQWRDERKLFGHCAQVQLGGGTVRLLKPVTYMNRSGQSVLAAMQFFKLEPGAVLVAHDELDLDPGVARFKHGGGVGGHNGLRDILSRLGGRREFYRLRLGIGHPGSADRVTPYVLNAPRPEERAAIDAATERSLAVMPTAVSGQWQQAMTALHSAPTP